MVRAFVAIDLPGTVKEELVQWQRRTEKAHPGLYRWTERESLHLTLYFLGEMDEADLDGLASRIGFSTGVELGLGRMMVLPEAVVPKILAVELSGDVATLKKQQQRLHDTVFAVAAHQETRPFRPHITVGRLKREVPPSAKPVKRLVGSMTAPSALTWSVDEVLVYESSLDTKGAVYSVRHRIPVSG